MRWTIIARFLIIGTAMFLPLAIAIASPLHAFRPWVYIIGSLSGTAALCLLLMQPLLAGGYIPLLSIPQARRWHRWVGSTLILAVVLHIGGLYLASPPDALDALLLVSPTPFSIYGVIGMWAVIATACQVALCRKFRLNTKVWRILHTVLVSIITVATVVHALMIEGAMGHLSKWFLCICVLGLTIPVIVNLQIIKPRQNNHDIRK